MEQILQRFVEIIQNFVGSNNIFISILSGIIAIILESIIPVLPLAVFIAINIIAFGNIWGFIISWIATIIGCSISFYICRKCSDFVQRKIKKDNKILSFINKIDEIKFNSLVLILAMPFTPAFSINIAAGLSKMKYKKYLLALIISKILIIYFWGYIGTTILESITDISIMIRLIIIIITLFISSKIVTKHFDL